MRQRQCLWQLSEDPRIDLAIRLAVAVPLAVAGIAVMVAGLRCGGLAAAGAMLVAAACFIGAGIMVAPWVAARIGNAAGGLFFPDRHFDRPQPVLSLAEGKRVQGRPMEALAEYERVLLEHPQETRCYIAMMDTAVRDLHDPALAEGYYRRGREALTATAAVASLDQAREEILRDAR